MKVNKNHLLMLAVVVIWAMIGYQLFSFINQSDSSDDTHMYTSRHQMDSVEVKKFELLANYRDPFMAKKNNVRHQPIRGAEIRNPATYTSSSTKTSFVQRPDMKYSGMIENNKLKTKIALLTKQNKSLMLKEGDKIDGFTIDKIWRDSVMIKYEQQRFTYKKNR